ncbi:MAG TPA: sugar phosphate isomerase/epimerase family protein [Planctomycetota bacterium]|jgi:sugar phosphate isomerase/epimerase
MRVILLTMIVLPMAAWAGELSNPFFAMDTAFMYGRDPKMPLEEKLDDLKSLGYAGFNWTNLPVPENVYKAADERGLKVFTTYVGMPLSKDKLAVPGNLEASCEALGKHGTMIWIHIGCEKGVKKSDEAGDEIAVPALQGAADIAAKHNVKLALYPHAGCWVESIDDCIRLSKKVNRPNFGLSFNLCHVLKVSGDAKVLDLLTAAQPHLFVLQISGADSGSQAAGWDKLIQPVGRGTYDLQPLIKLAVKNGFTGPIGFQGYGIKGERKAILTETMEGWKKLKAAQ